MVEATSPLSVQTPGNNMFLNEDPCIEKPSYRVLIQILLSLKARDVKRLEGSQHNRYACFSKKFHLLFFLLICSLLCGASVGTLTCSTKMLMDSIALLKGQSAIEILMNPKIIFIGLLIPAAIVENIWTLNQSMSLYSQLHVLPLYESSCILFNLLAGGLILNEFSLYSHRQLSFIVLGCSLSITGILFKLMTSPAANLTKTTQDALL